LLLDFVFGGGVPIAGRSYDYSHCGISDSSIDLELCRDGRQPPVDLVSCVGRELIPVLSIVGYYRASANIFSNGKARFSLFSAFHSTVLWPGNFCKNHSSTHQERKDPLSITSLAFAAGSL
jgi:hypothetical protein